jgi:hypothetical protein
MTTGEAVTLIEMAAGPQALFGGDPSRTYRRLARLTHPDIHPGDDRAAVAFTKLAALWRQHQGRHGQLGPVVASGDIANLYRTTRGLVKIARDPADNDLLDREAAALTRLHTRGDPRYRAYVPVLVDTQRHEDPRSGLQRRANVLGQLSGFRSLAEVRAAFPGGLDARDTAWMWRRLLVAVGFARNCGIIHAAVVPEHVLIHPAEHGLVLVDWCYSVSQPAGLVPAVPARYRDWYPAEVLSGHAPGPDLDIYLATRCMTQLTGARTPAPLAAFAAGCTLPDPAHRPDDAWRLVGELDDLLERLYGARKFRPFAMPA